MVVKNVEGDENELTERAALGANFTVLCCYPASQPVFEFDAQQVSIELIYTIPSMAQKSNTPTLLRNSPANE